MICQARYEKAKELKLGFCCLAGKHVVKDCTYKACGVKGCSRWHHRLLHREANERRKESGVEDPQRKAEANSTFCTLRSSGILPVIPVIIQVGKRQESTLALCDSGASLSFIDKELADKLNAHGEEFDLSVAGIHGTNEVKCERLTVGIRGNARSDTHHKTVYTWAVKTKLGWTLCGPLLQQEAVQMTACCVTAPEDEALAEQIKTWWDIESYASDCDVSGRSKEDEKALQMLEQNTKFDDERY